MQPEPESLVSPFNGFASLRTKRSDLFHQFDFGFAACVEASRVEVKLGGDEGFFGALDRHFSPRRYHSG